MFQEMTLRKAVELAVLTEQVGFEFYDMMAKKFAATEEVARIFTQLAKDERGHEARFAALLEKIPEDVIAGDSKEGDQYLRALAYSTLLDKQAIAGYDKIEEASVALARALDFEKSTLAYYEAIRGVLGGSPVIDAIIAEERRHLINLFRVIAADGAFRSVDERW